MADQENPRLINSDNGSIIEINSNPFTLGRGLSCNFVIPIHSISRIHCVLEKNFSGWVLKDTSTNGTCVNGQLIKDDRSPPLKDSDVIDLDRARTKFVFQHSVPTGDISDEQLCRIADSLLDEVVDVNDSSIQIINDSSVQIITEYNPELPSIIEDGMLPCKRLKMDHSTTDNTNNSIIDLTSDSFRKSMNTETVSSMTTEIAGPSKVSEEIQSEVDKPIEKCQTATDTDNREELEDEMQCSICSEMFVKAVTLNCAHTFCKYCIEMWSKNKMICPICRTKITSITPTLVVDNVIEMVIQNSSEETKQHRKQLLEDRQKCVEPPPKLIEKIGATGGVGGVTNNLSVIEVSSSSSDSDASTVSDSDWQDDYSEDGWYNRGYSGPYYGGYGHCFSCGRRGHWANGCPYR